jgi:hypothetical protein
MKKLVYFYTITLIIFSGCTQVVTAPIDVAGSVIGATIDVADTAVDTVSDSNEEEKED